MPRRMYQQQGGRPQSIRDLLQDPYLNPPQNYVEQMPRVPPQQQMPTRLTRPEQQPPPPQQQMPTRLTRPEPPPPPPQQQIPEESLTPIDYNVLGEINKCRIR